MVTCVLVLVLLITGLARSVRGRRLAPSMVLGVALLALWAYEFFGQTLGCAPVPADHGQKRAPVTRDGRLDIRGLSALKREGLCVASGT
jgi:hypothetical protein